MRVRAAGVAGASLLAAVAVLAGCASGPVGQHTAGKPGRSAEPPRQAAAAKTAATTKPAARVAPVRPVGPPAGTQAEAEAFAQQMLSSVILPAGSRLLPPAAEPQLLRTFAGRAVAADPAVSPFRLYRLAMPMAAAISFAQAHLPTGEIPGGSGKRLGGSKSGVLETNSPVTEEYLDAQARRVPVGIDIGELEYSVVPGSSGSSVLQVNADVVWYPPRPAAEDFTAASYRAVKLVDDAGHGRIISKTFSSRQVIGQLVTLLDGLHVSTEPAATCGLLGTDGSGLELLSATKGQPNVHAFYGCPGYSIYLGAKAEPPLQPQYPDDTLWALITRLLGLPNAD